MHAFLKTSAIAIVIALTGIPAGGSASAQDLELHLGKNGPQLRVSPDCDPYREDCRDRRDGRRDDRRDGDRDRRSDRRECSPERALDKADRMGVRRARIGDVGRRTISVRGRDRHGDRIVVTFDRRDRRCPVLSGF